MGLDWDTWGVLADFRRCQIASQHTDLVFHCANGKVSAHRMIFAGISRLVTDLIQRYLVNQELFPIDLNISLPEIRREHMERVVEMVYTGQVPITKRDYPPFREICQLLDLCVPIADYDKFFLNQCDDEADNGDHEDDGSNGDVQFIQHFNCKVEIPEVGIPLPSCSSPQIFVCGDCDALFPLKIALKRHKENQHGETESQALDPPPLPVETQPSTPTQLNTRPRRQRSLKRRKLILENEDFPEIESVMENTLENESQVSNPLASPIVSEPSVGTSLTTRPRGQRSLKRRKQILENEDFLEIEESEIETEVENTREYDSQTSDPPASPIVSEPQLNTQPRGQQLSNKEKNFFCSPNKERKVKCPDCQKLCATSEVRYHLAVHLSDQLDELATKSLIEPGLFKCKSCPYEINDRYRMRKHLALTHNMITKFANEDQMKFLNDTKKLINQAKSLCQTQKTKKIDKLKTRKQVLEIEDVTEIDDDLETEVENTLENLSGTLDPPAVPIVSEPSTEPQLNTQLRNQQLSNREKNLVCSPNKERRFECPDCQKLCAPSNVKHHLSLHLKDQLKEFATKRTSGSGLFKCELCSYETTCQHKFWRHWALTHNMVVEFANEAQKKFLDDAQMSRVARRMLRRKKTGRLARYSIRKKDVKEITRGVKCPDCLKLICAPQVRDHLVTHLRKPLNKLLTESESTPGLLKCHLCTYESRCRRQMCYHLGCTHKMLTKYATEAQKKFMADGQKLMIPAGRKRKLSLKEKK